MKANWKTKLMSGLILGSLVLSLTAIVAAQEPSGGPDGGPPTQLDKPRPEDHVKRLRASLDKLVEKKILESDQSHRVMLFFQQKDDERKAEWDKMKSMTPEDRDTYVQQQCILRCQKRPDLIKDLMEGAGLSQEQAKAVAQEMRPPHGPGGPGPGPGPDRQAPPSP